MQLIKINRLIALLSFAAIFVLASITLAVEPHPATSEPTTISTNSAPRSSTEMTKLVDDLLKGHWQAEEITPARTSSDAEFLRRVYLDLVGTLPSPAEATRFLDDQTKTKRSVLIEQLLTHPLHPTHLANTWRRILIGDQSAADPTGGAGQVGMQRWLRDQFADNTRFDRLVGNFLTVSGEEDVGPVIYYRLLELKPEKLASSVARSFLGVQLQCAECHDHPFVATEQEDFWSFAAFFARVRNRYGAEMSPFGRFSLYETSEGEVTLPDGDKTIQPRYPGSDKIVEDRGTRRQQLSLWMASPENRYLAPATVNRLWSLLFGRGLVHPVDDMGPHNPSEHPELLASLTEYFVSTGYDLRDLFSVLTNSHAYQRSSRCATDQRRPASSFAQMQVKSLTADQLFDALRATLRLPYSRPGSGGLAESQRQAFTMQMKSQSNELTKLESSVQQTLVMMNGQITERFINSDQNGLIAALTAPFLSDEDRLDQLFLASLTRKPTEQERVTFMEHLKSKNDTTAAQDILWALVNSAEYRLNH